MSSFERFKSGTRASAMPIVAGFLLAILGTGVAKITTDMVEDALPQIAGGEIAKTLAGVYNKGKKI